MKIESSEEAEELAFLIENVCGKCNISHMTVCKDCFMMKFKLEIANYIGKNAKCENEFDSHGMEFNPSTGKYERTVQNEN